jgi:hypothetical protein
MIPAELKPFLVSQIDPEEAFVGDIVSTAIVMNVCEELWKNHQHTF